MSEKPEWIVGAGLDTDFGGDRKSVSQGRSRFWMPKGDTRRVIFLTEGDEAPVLWEHQYKANGNWQNWITCLKPLGIECPFCDWSEASDNNEFRRYKAAFFTIIDTSEYTDRSGTVHKNTKRLMCCKSGTAEKIKRKWMRLQEDGKPLRGAMFEIYRTNGDKSPSVGEDFEYIKHVDLDVLEDSVEFDYAEMLKPDVDAAAAAIAALKEERGIASKATSYDVPF
jgi:hypothetical protein